MPLKEIFLLLFALPIFTKGNFSNTCFPGDSIIAKKYIYDTVYVPPDTLYLTDTVYIEDNSGNPGGPKAFFIDVNSGLGLPFGNYKGDEFPVNRINSEFQLYKTRYFNIYGGYFHNSFQFTTGIEYMDIEEKVEHAPRNILLDITAFPKNETTFYAVTKGNDTIWVPVYYEVIVTDTSYHELNYPFINNHRFISLPFRFSYLTSGENLIYRFNLQTAINIRFGNKINDVVLLDNVNNLVLANNRYNITKVSLSCSLSTEALYPVNQHLSIYIGVIFDVKSINYGLNNQSIIINPLTVGCKAGVIKYFKISF